MHIRHYLVIIIILFSSIPLASAWSADTLSEPQNNGTTSCLGVGSVGVSWTYDPSSQMMNVVIDGCEGEYIAPSGFNLLLNGTLIQTQNNYSFNPVNVGNYTNYNYSVCPYYIVISGFHNQSFLKCSVVFSPLLPMVKECVGLNDMGVGNIGYSAYSVSSRESLSGCLFPRFSSGFQLTSTMSINDDLISDGYYDENWSVEYSYFDAKGMLLHKNKHSVVDTQVDDSKALTITENYSGVVNSYGYLAEQWIFVEETLMKRIGFNNSFIVSKGWWVLINSIREGVQLPNVIAIDSEQVIMYDSNCNDIISYVSANYVAGSAMTIAPLAVAVNGRSLFNGDFISYNSTIEVLFKLLESRTSCLASSSTNVDLFLEINITISNGDRLNDVIHIYCDRQIYVSHQGCTTLLVFNIGGGPRPISILGGHQTSAYWENNVLRADATVDGNLFNPMTGNRTSLISSFSIKVTTF